jgi:proteasome lid subunit RPN8/RPN11
MNATRPSAEDIRLAMKPDISYVIVSPADPFAPEVRSFMITGGKAEEEELRIVHDCIVSEGRAL